MRPSPNESPDSFRRPWAACTRGDFQTAKRISGSSRTAPGQRVLLVCTLAHPDGQGYCPWCLWPMPARAMGAVQVGLVGAVSGLHAAGPAVSGRRSHHVADDWWAPVEVRSTGSLPSIRTCTGTVRLREIYTVPCRVVHAAPALAAWIAAHVNRPVLVGPDEESEQWVSTVAALAQAPYLVLRKVRHGDQVVDVSAPDVAAHRDRTPVVVDDIVSTAGTMIETVHALLRARLPAPVCVAVHALFAGEAEAALRAAGVAQVVTTTSVPHTTNAIDIVPLLADAIRRTALRKRTSPRAESAAAAPRSRSGRRCC